MNRIKVTNVLQGKVVLKDKHYAIGFVTKYGVATIRMNEMDKFLEQNPHLKPILRSSVIEADQIIGKFINVRNKQQKYYIKMESETRIRIF
jgi:hypothetical protein